eukprot:2729784-Amphidinium_carterae.1
MASFGRKPVKGQRDCSCSNHIRCSACLWSTCASTDAPVGILRSSKVICQQVQHRRRSEAPLGGGS